MKKIIISLLLVGLFCMLPFATSCDDEVQDLHGKTFVFYKLIDDLDNENATRKSNGFTEYEWIRNNFASNIDFTVSGMGSTNQQIAVPNSIVQSGYGYTSSNITQSKQAFSSTSSVDSIITEFRNYAANYFDELEYNQITIAIPEDYSQNVIVKNNGAVVAEYTISTDSTDTRLNLKSTDYQEIKDTNGMQRASLGTTGDLFYGGIVDGKDYIEFNFSTSSATRWVSEDYRTQSPTKTDTCIYPITEYKNTSNRCDANFGLLSSVPWSMNGFNGEAWTFTLTIYAAFVEE